MVVSVSNYLMISGPWPTKVDLNMNRSISSVDFSSESKSFMSPILPLRYTLMPKSFAIKKGESMKFLKLPRSLPNVSMYKYAKSTSYRCINRWLTFKNCLNSVSAFSFGETNTTKSLDSLTIIYSWR